MFTILLHLLFATNAHASSLLERKIFDPYIICHNPPPPAYAFPPGYSGQDYPNSRDLCSAANGRRGSNVGCFCSSPFSELHCDPKLADATLSEATTRHWNRTNDHRESFADFCYDACYCADTKSAAIAHDSLQRNSELNRVLNGQYDPFPFTNPPSDEVTRPVSLRNQCGSNCSSNADCAGLENGCACKTQNEQYVPGKGTVIFAAACTISLGGKREKQRPCPCNETYVSHACCGATGGIVQEPEQFKLGELLVVDEL